MIRFKYILFLFLIGFFFFSEDTFAQKKELTPEEKQRKIALEKEAEYLKFQTHFFEAINQKARQDYSKAIESLEKCKEIYPNDNGLNYEFAKNYFELKEYDNAIFFAQKVVEQKKENLAVLEFIKNAYRLQFDYDNAIKFQKKITALKPDRENDLVYLYIKNKQKDKAKESYLKLKKLRLLDYRKDYFTNILFPKKKSKTTNVSKNQQPKVPKNKFALIKEELIVFWTKKDYLNLDKKSSETLKKYSAQPFVYLMQGRALIGLQKPKKAIQHLEFGLDFVLPNNKTMLLEFYKELKVAYDLSGYPSKGLKYQQKIDAIKSK